MYTMCYNVCAYLYLIFDDSLIFNVLMSRLWVVFLKSTGHIYDVKSKKNNNNIFSEFFFPQYFSAVFVLILCPLLNV